MIKPKLKPCSGCGKPRVIWKNVGRGKYCKECYSKSLTGVAKSMNQLQKRIPTFSSKMQKKKALYSVARAKFLEDHPMCEFHHPGICTQKSTEVHHTAGRIEELLLDTRYWKAGCHNCHEWAEKNPKLAKELGYSVPRLTKKE